MIISVKNRTENLRKLDLNTRNQVRAILASEEKDSFKLINKLRKKRGGKELLQIERALRTYRSESDQIIPELFPSSPQTREEYHRLEKIPLRTTVDHLNGLVIENMGRLTTLITSIKNLNELIVKADYCAASTIVLHIIGEYGHSHLLLRKATLIKIRSEEISDLRAINELLELAGLEEKNVVVTSLQHCFTEDQDYLHQKKAILNLPRRGTSNKFTRDICRMAFHPFAKNDDEFAELIQSNLQSSLIDAVIFAKINDDYLRKCGADYSAIAAVIDYLESSSPSTEDIASLYAPVGRYTEDLFHKQSSAWYENSTLVSYRRFVEHFGDNPEADYLRPTSEILSCISGWARKVTLEDLAACKDMTMHSSPALKAIESHGATTRSAMFNFALHNSEGSSFLDEKTLIELMECTADLAKTINVDHAVVLAKMSSSRLSKLIIYFLIAKRSRNEKHDFMLRRILQEVVIKDHEKDIIKFFRALNSASTTVATYAYEVCSEDFIARLFHLIGSTSEITETRAALHKWMGEVTGEQAYVDRARTLLIDHQLNKIRNEIDDNRIYVDSARFFEWINDEVIRDLSVTLSGLAHTDSLAHPDDPRLMQIINECYTAFCSNNIFGVASYLGRRIRHGTFKGHLYSSVVSVIERDSKFEKLHANFVFTAYWSRWKRQYEEIIEDAINNKLHIESSTKREGLLKPGINTPAKQEIAWVCIKHLAKEFAETKNTLSAPSLINEYCWRLAEHDLFAVTAYIKNTRPGLVNTALLTEMRESLAHGRHAHVVKDFCRDLLSMVDEKLLAMYSWFKKPANVAPSASLSLLYKAVVAEVKETFADFTTQTDFDDQPDIEVVGGSYHILYDCLYVVVYNAAKHGKSGNNISRIFSIESNDLNSGKILRFQITSTIRDDANETEVTQRLLIPAGDDLATAQVDEGRSGIRKLYSLQLINKNFFIEEISCKNREVVVRLGYALEH